MIDLSGVPPEPVSRLVLASGSPRRRLLLAMAGFSFDVIHPHVDETPRGDEGAGAMVTRLAAAKAETVATIADAGSWVLACDTTVTLDGRIIGKPESEDEAVAMLLSLAGRTHEVATGYALRGGSGPDETGIAWSTVTMRSIGRAEAAAYAAGGEPLDKAGAYALQGEGARFVASVEGSRSNVIGLPLEAVVPLLVARGIPSRRGPGEARW